MFYNTPNYDAAQLEVFQKQTEKQEDFILSLFQQHKEGLSPWQVHRLCERYRKMWPITSVRRAITDLEKNEKLVKTGKQVMGPYGVREYVWKPI